MHRLILASENRGKLREIQALLAGLPVELVLPTDLGLQLNVAETGTTYHENASLKAAAYARASGLLALGDDSGLEVDALGGKPGLYSHRFAPWPDATDADRRRYLIEQLQPHPRPWPAHFHCTVALCTPAGEVRYAEGDVYGEIIPTERGTDGFGYDPVFLVAELGKTMAELSMAEKNQLSHRARAIRAAEPILHELLRLD